MGTNYYLHRKPPCCTCGKPAEEPLHIGKSSGGWCFTLHIIPDAGIDDLGDWRKLWALPEAVIMNEYDEKVPIAEMEAIITERSHKGNPVGLGYRNEREFHQVNHSQRGPNGLLRHALGTFCVKHGEGTWDCLLGKFA